MKKFLKLFCCMMVAALLVSGCSKDEKKDEPSNGNNVTDAGTGGNEFWMGSYYGPFGFVVTPRYTGEDAVKNATALCCEITRQNAPASGVPTGLPSCMIEVAP